MKRIFLLVIIAFSATVFAQQSRLPDCSGAWSNSSWSSCYGILSYGVEKKYIGDFKDEYPHGSGKFFYADGVVFKGEVFRGKRQGKGETQYANGDRYVGEFFEDLKDGVILNLAGAEGASATTSAAAASAGENGITGLIKSASSIGTDLLSNTTLIAGRGDVLGAIRTAGTSYNTFKNVDLKTALATELTAGLSTSSLTNLASTATTALSSVKGQGSTAVKALIDSPSVSSIRALL